MQRQNNKEQGAIKGFHVPDWYREKEQWKQHREKVGKVGMVCAYLVHKTSTSFVALLAQSLHFWGMQLIKYTKLA